MKELTRYYKIIKSNGSDTKSTHLKAQIYYALGGHNEFTSKIERRGYYISVSPVQKNGCSESYVAFTGLKQCVIPVKRQSKKKMEEAIEYFNQHEKEFMAQHFSDYEIDANYEKEVCF